MKAACLTGSSLRDTTSGLRCSMPSRCSSAIRPDRLWYVDAEFLLDPGANFAGRPRQRLGDPGFQLLLLLVAQAALAALVAEARQPLDTLFLIQTVPSADRVVVQQEDLRDRLAAHPVVQQDQRVRAPGRRCAAEPSRARSVNSRRDSLSRKPGRIMRGVESGPERLARGFFGYPVSWGIYRIFLQKDEADRAGSAADVPLGAAAD